MQIIKYDSKYKDKFIQYNSEWIVDNFGYLEEGDKKAFESIEDELSSGAMIFFALEEDDALATCMAKPMDDDTWEICKLASDKVKPHKGFGSAVFEASINWAVDHGAKRLFILSNSKLKAACHIYEKFGFSEIKLENYFYERGNIAFEKIVHER